MMLPGLILLGLALATAIGLFLAVRSSIVVIGDREVGLVFKRIDLRSINHVLPADRLIALNGEAGWQADTLSPGVHLGFWPWMYRISRVPLVQIPTGKVGLVVAKDGAPLPVDRQFGRVVECGSFQDARAFLVNGGQKGRQLGLLTTGTYRINTQLFTVITSANAVQHGLAPDDLRVHVVKTGYVGIITTQEGAPITTGDRAGPVVPGHNGFQNAQQFLDAGGCKGLQEEVLQAGSYNLNRWFVEVEHVPLLYIPTGTVGVVKSDVGKKSPHQTSDELVEQGYQGVWRTPLPPGRHPLNLEVYHVAIVPTYEITLDWSNKEKDPLNYDAPLHKIRLRSNDGYDFDIEVTQVISIRGEDAPRMILRVGVPSARQIDQDSLVASKPEKYRSIRNLVMRVLEPLVGSYFRNSAQDYGVLDFLHNRSERQREAFERIQAALSTYGVQAVGTFINDIDLPPDIERTLQARTLAEEQKKTIITQTSTAQERRHLNEAEAKADTQAALIKAEAAAQAFRLKSAAEAEWRRALELIKVEVLERTIKTLSVEGYLEKVRSDNLAKLKLPDQVFGTNLLDAFFAQIVGNMAAPHSAPPQFDVSTLAGQLVEFLKQHPSELQVVLKSLAIPTLPIDGTPRTPHLSIETEVDATGRDGDV